MNKRLREIISNLQENPTSPSDIEEFFSIVYKFSKELCPRYGRVGEDAESDANYIVHKILPSLPKFDLTKPPLAYVTTITRNFCIDEIRKQKTVNKINSKAKEINMTDSYTQEPVSTRHFVEDVLGPDSIYITGPYFDNLSFEELAEVTGEPVRKVKQKVGKAASLIKEEIYGR